MKTLASHELYGSIYGGNNREGYSLSEESVTVDSKSITNQPVLIDSNTLIQRRFQERDRLRETICKTNSYKNMTETKSLKGRISNLGGGLISWCRIPKVGSTYLQGLEKTILREIAEKTGFVPKTKTIVIVREPYSRLVSGYVGKIVTTPPWSRRYGAAILRRFRPMATDKTKKCGIDVTFPEYLKYVIEADLTGWKRNLHFVPMHEQCNPCGTSYDYIAHLETFKDDLSFVLRSVNITVELDFNDDEITMRRKAKTIVSHKELILQCESMCSALSKVWWSFHTRGLISTEIKFPLSNEECDTINGTEFADLAWDAHIQSTGRVDREKQRWEAVTTLYRQASLVDRMKIRDLLLKDFELYGYDSKPPDIFPELYNKL